MNRSLLAIAALLAGMSALASAHATPTVYNSAALFASATSSIQTQTFEGVAANLGVGVGEAFDMNNSLNSSTNAAMLPGLDISAMTNIGEDLSVVGPDFLGTGLSNYSIFANHGPLGLNFAFSPGTTAASLNLLSEFDPGDMTVEVYSPSDVLVGSYIVSNPPTSGAGQFFGVTDAGGIGRMTITIPDAPYPGVDQVQWGTVASVPEPAFYQMTALLALGGLGVLHTRRRGSAK